MGNAFNMKPCITSLAIQMHVSWAAKGSFHSAQCVLGVHLLMQAAWRKQRRRNPLIALPDTQTGKTDGLTPKRPGVASMNTTVVCMRVPCLSIATRATQIGVRAGHLARRHGAVRTRAVGAHR